MASSTSVVLSSDILEKLKCVKCLLHLTVPPIMYNSEQKLVCGRCLNHQGFLIVRATAFETVAKLLSFPCRYAANGCLENLNWEAVQEHEVSCRFRVFKCPSMDVCAWQGPCKMFQEHLTDKHEYLQYTGDFPLDLETNFLMKSFIHAFKETFCLKMRVDTEFGKIIFGMVYSASQQDVSTTYTGALELKTIDNHNAVKFSCNIQSNNWESIFNENEMSEISIDSIKYILSTPAVLCKIIITDNSKTKKSTKKKKNKVVEESVLPSSNEPTPVLNKVLLNELECPVCNEYMISEIFVCQNGHSICGDCETKIAICPNCRAPFGKIRNFALEKLTTCITYPCRNEYYGCNFIGRFDQIKEHNKNCPLQLIDCPLKDEGACNWRGLFENILLHIREKHAEYVWMGEFLYWDISAAVSSKVCMITTYDEQLFKICCVQNLGAKGAISWVFQQIGLTAADVSPYKFELEFIDQTNKGRRFIINQVCQGLMEIKEALKNSLNISQSLLRPFISQTRLCYKYEITKIKNM